MSREATFKPVEVPGRKAAGIAAWMLNVPSHLSSSGKRQRLFFQTKAEALGACEQLKARRDNFGVSLNTMDPTRITEASEAYKLLDGLNISLLTAVRSFVASHKQRVKSVTLEELFRQYIHSKPDCSDEYKREIGYCLDKFPQIKNRMVCDVSHQDLESVLNGLSKGARSKNMVYLGGAFRYGIKRGYVSENPVSRLERPKKRRKEVETIPVEQVERMLNYCLEKDKELLPYVVLGIFCGIRPDQDDGELSKLQWSDIHLDGAKPQVVMRAEITKRNQRRFIDIQPNVVQWLMICPDRTGAVVKTSTRYRRAKMLWETGLGKLPHDAMRHTFASNHLAHFKDQNSLMQQLGHQNPDELHVHYNKATQESEAARFWSLLPSAETANIVPFAAAG